MTWTELCELYLSQYKTATRSLYWFALREYTEWCAENEIEPLTVSRAQFLAFFRTLQSRHAQSTASNRLGAVVGAYRLAVEEEVLDKNPAGRVKIPPVDRTLQKRTVLSPLEFAAFLKTAESLGATEHAIAALGGMLGLRAQEMLDLTASSLGLSRGYVTLSVLSKGDKIHLLPLPVPVARPVVALSQKHPTGYLIQSRTGQQMTRMTLLRIVQRIARHAGITHHITTHGLRRTYATSGFMKGVSLRDMQIAMRHARSDTTLLYDLDRQNLDRHASHEIAAFLSGFSM